MTKLQSKYRKLTHVLEIKPVNAFLGYSTTGVATYYPDILPEAREFVRSFGEEVVKEPIDDLPALSALLKRKYRIKSKRCPKYNKVLWDIEQVDKLMKELNIKGHFA